MQVEAMHSTVRHKCISIKKKIIFEVSTMQIEAMHSTVRHKCISINKKKSFLRFHPCRLRQCTPQ